MGGFEPAIFISKSHDLFPVCFLKVCIGSRLLTESVWLVGIRFGFEMIYQETCTPDLVQKALVTVSSLLGLINTIYSLCPKLARTPMTIGHRLNVLATNLVINSTTWLRWVHIQITRCTAIFTVAYVVIATSTLDHKLISRLSCLGSARFCQIFFTNLSDSFIYWAVDYSRSHFSMTFSWLLWLLITRKCFFQGFRNPMNLIREIFNLSIIRTVALVTVKTYTVISLSISIRP